MAILVARGRDFRVWVCWVCFGSRVTIVYSEMNNNMEHFYVPWNTYEGKLAVKELGFKLPV